MNEPITIVLIDDDPINIFLAKTVMQRVATNPTFYTFTEAKAGVEFISNTISVLLETNPLIFLLLDIDMPDLDGWQFLEDEFEKLEMKHKNKLPIFMLSSSTLPSDKERALKNRFVTDYIEKPITYEKSRLLFEQVIEKKKTNS